MIEPLSSRVTEYNLDIVTTTKDGLGIEEVPTGEATQTTMVEDVLGGTGVVAEIPKS